jgi:hypothetical protein
MQGAGIAVSLVWAGYGVSSVFSPFLDSFAAASR